MKASIYDSELEFISRCVLDYENLETGGDLFGYWDKNGNPVVLFVTGSGKNTKRTNGSFYQDIDYLHECVQYLYKNHALEHIGSWHSHHEMNLSYPSSGDSATVMNSLNSFPAGKFLLVICNILSVRNKEVSVNGFIFSKTQENYREIKWVTLLAKESPYRKEIDKDKGARFITNPKTKKAVPVFKKEYLSECTINQNIQQTKKPTLPSDYYFNTQEGQDFLRDEYEKLNNHQDVSDLEIVQNENDGTVGFTFKLCEVECEINYPLDFSKENPKPIFKEIITSQQEVKLEKEQKKYITREFFVYNINDIIGKWLSFRNEFLIFK